MIRSVSFAAALAILSISSIASAAETQVLNVKDGMAFGDIISYGECFQKEVIIVASEQQYKQGSGGPVWAASGFMIVADSDLCLGTQVAEIGEIQITSFTVSSMQTARVVGTVQLVNFSTFESRTAAFDLSFQGSGDINRGVTHTNEEFPGGRIVAHTNGTSRFALVTGFVTAADGSNFIEGATGVGGISRVISGSVTKIIN